MALKLLGGPPLKVLPESVRDINHGIRLVSSSLNFVPPKRVGQYGPWVLFPRFDRAKDDQTFWSGIAVKIGSREILRWEDK